MSKSNDKNVSEFIHDLQTHASDRYKIVKAIREIVLRQNSAFDESIKYGGIVYQKDNELLAGVFVYKNHVSLELGKGFELDDIYSVLEGKGKYRRHIKFYNLLDVEEKSAEYYINAAMN